MAYTVLARRYRSTTFDELVGQEPIVRTLRAAIAQGKVGHAYLFCGTRGVGKTTTARILARELAGGSPEADAAILAGRDTDVIEIDGASNNSVDNARELIGNSVYRPLRGRHKVYIIDEVHMLSTQAFNALLKVMEEPPEHVTFILCTTEAHKVPATVQSRCQRFDFRPLPAARIADHLARVVADEGLEAEPDLLRAVAHLSGGSMRDALSLMDRLIAAGAGRLTVALLDELLGLPDRALAGALVDALAGGDAAEALCRTDDLLARGTSPDMLLDALAQRLRDLMVMNVCGAETDLVDVPEAARGEEAGRAGRFDAAGLVHMIALCESVQRTLRSSASPRALLDAVMVRLALSEKFADAAGLVAALRGGPDSGEPAERRAPAKKR